MTTCDGVEHWDDEGLKNVIGTMDGIHKSHVKLGDTLDGVQANLESWGGLTAEAWRAYHGKIRIDINEQGHQAKAVADKLRPLYDEVLGIKARFHSLKATIVNNGHFGDDGQMHHWKLNNDGTIDTGGSTKSADEAFAKQQLEDEMKALLHKADGVDQEIADALKAITTPGGAPASEPHPGQPAPQQKPKTDESINASGQVGGPDGNPGYKNGAKPDTAPAAHTAQLADNPPGWNFPPGAERDQSWKDYLNGKNADGTQRAYGQMPQFLPKPEAVQDKGLRTIGAAGRQQGVSYAWGANHSVDGPTRGTLNGDPPNGGAHQYHDDQRIGFDCGGLSRFAVWQGHGDIDLGEGTSHQWQSLGGAKAQITNPAPGDLIYWGQGASDHVAINLGNGALIQAPSSGQGVGLSTIDAMDKAEGEGHVYMHPGG